jgi:cytosine deaminase
MAMHVGHLTGVAEIKSCFDAVTANAAKVLNLENYGLAPGGNADLIILQAADPIEAIRLQAERLFVIRRGKILAQTEPRVAKVQFGGEVKDVDFTRANLDLV